jgi:signal transduction histidine kinase
MDMQKPDETTAARPVKILAVDDREDNLLSIETILEETGYQIVKATSGRAALKTLLKEQDFTLILMDVQMPDMNGFETAALIYEREKLRHIPIIFITAHNQGEEKMYEGYKLGGVDFIYKPINPELLRFKVGVFAELYQKTQQLIQQEKKLIASNSRLENEVDERRSSEEKVRLLNEQLLQKNQQLQLTIEELDRFAYVASHDLQEPLRKILVFSDKLQSEYRQDMEPEVQKSLDKIVNASRRMHLLINDLLRFSRETNVAENFEAVDLNVIVREVVADLDAEEQMEAALEVQPLPTVWGINSQMRQLFQNLLSNAFKFRRTEVEPVVKVYCLDKVNGQQLPGRICRIVVEDNGVGFDARFADEIFVVFKRLHSYQEFPGSGVGLAICKKIVDRHAGKISVDSTMGAGSRFYIDLPVPQNLSALQGQSTYSAILEK